MTRHTERPRRAFVSPARGLRARRTEAGDLRVLSAHAGAPVRLAGGTNADLVARPRVPPELPVPGLRLPQRVFHAVVRPFVRAETGPGTSPGRRAASPRISPAAEARKEACGIRWITQTAKATGSVGPRVIGVHISADDGRWTMNDEHVPAVDGALTWTRALDELAPHPAARPGRRRGGAWLRLPSLALKVLEQDYESRRRAVRYTSRLPTHPSEAGR